LFTGSTSYSNLSNLQINQVNFGTQTSVPVDVDIKAQATQGTLTYSGGALTSNVVLQVGGDDGYNVFNFDSGTTVAQIEQAINGVSDATGVAASINNSGKLVFNSTDYGSNAFVSVQAVSGTFNTYSGSNASTRSTGTDVQATINGVAATGNGLQASIDTPTLDLSFNVATGLTSGSTFNFSITGGGANFQLGPDVVSNQQARLGIQSVNTASLGGADGLLYELGTGGSLSLSTNVGGAANVVNEALNEITSLRGRLGAFQSTTLQTNIDTLQTTLTNLTSAQSNIQDTDFATETASLTRAQILVQAGTQVLQIANQNPANVLKLLQSTT
jgi:flagellin